MAGSTTLNTAATAQVVGEQRRVISQPTAAIRNADGSATLRATIWYPAAPTAETVSIDIGPAEVPYMLVGHVASDASFASGRRYPVILSFVIPLSNGRRVAVSEAAYWRALHGR